MGADFKVGLSSNITLDATINPDFGQVEADPAELNLTAFETFFPEKRPFFTEGIAVFNYDVVRGGSLSVYTAHRLTGPCTGRNQTLWTNREGS